MMRGTFELLLYCGGRILNMMGFAQEMRSIDELPLWTP